jgi:hypothetical protein
METPVADEPKMVEVDQKPKDLHPVDPDVKIPDSIKRRSAAVDAYYAQQKPAQTSEGQEVQPPSPPMPPQAVSPDTPPVQPAPPAEPPVVAEPTPTFDPNERPTGPIENGSWEQKYLALQGRYKKDTAEMREQMSQLGDELMRTQEVLQKPGNGSQPPSMPRGYLTEKDVQEYGPDVLDLAQRAALHAVTPNLSRLEDENAKLRRQLAEDRKRGLYQTLDAQIPDWRQIDNNPRWRQWLHLPDLYSGRIRQQLLNDAIQAADATRVSSFFRGFLAEEAATGHLEPSPQPRPTPPVPPREPAIPLASLAAPGRARPASGGDFPPSSADRPTYTRADITAAHKAYMRGAYKGREAEYEALQAEFIRAQQEGRLR